MQAGFYNSSLLASFCTFASAVVAGGAGLRLHGAGGGRRRWCSCCVVLATFSTGDHRVPRRRRRCGPESGSRRGRVAAAAACLAGAAAVVFLTVASVTLDPSRPGDISIGSEPSGRRQTAVASARTLAEHPWLGKGLGSFPGGWDGQVGQAHLTALEVAAVQGPVALAGLAAWSSCSGEGGAGRPTWRRGAPLAAMAVDSLAMDVHRFRHVWILLGMADAGRSRPDRPDDAGTPASPPQSSASLHSRAHGVRSRRSASCAFGPIDRRSATAWFASVMSQTSGVDDPPSVGHRQGDGHVVRLQRRLVQDVELVPAVRSQGTARPAPRRPSSTVERDVDGRGVHPAAELDGRARGPPCDRAHHRVRCVHRDVGPVVTGRSVPSRSESDLQPSGQAGPPVVRLEAIS